MACKSDLLENVLKTANHHNCRASLEEVNREVNMSMKMPLVSKEIEVKFTQALRPFLERILIKVCEPPGLFRRPKVGCCSSNLLSIIASEKSKHRLKHSIPTGVIRSQFYMLEHQGPRAE